MGNAAAFFDVDGTLLRGDTDILWGRYLGWHRRIPLGRWLWLELEFLLHRLGRNRPGPWVWLQTCGARGRRPEEMVAGYLDFVDRQVRPRIVASGLEAIAWHRSLQHTVVLLSAVGAWRLQAIRELFRADEILGTLLEIRNGCYSGGIREPYCYGEGKVYWASRFCRVRDVDPSRAFFYGNSRGDIPMLRWVGYPRVIQPDRWLAREALRAGWPIFRFHDSWLREGETGGEVPRGGPAEEGQGE